MLSTNQRYIGGFCHYNVLTENIVQRREKARPLYSPNTTEPRGGRDAQDAPPPELLTSDLRTQPPEKEQEGKLDREEARVEKCNGWDLETEEDSLVLQNLERWDHSLGS